MLSILHSKGFGDHQFILTDRFLTVFWLFTISAIDIMKMVLVDLEALIEETGNC